MKKLLSLLLYLLIISTTVCAYDIVNLPDTLLLSEVLGIYDVSDIASATFKNLDDCNSITIPSNTLHDMFSASKNMKLTRTINRHPFSGYAIEFKTTAGEKSTFYFDSGVEIGKYGNDNFVCYEPGELTEEMVGLIEIYNVSLKTEDDSFQINSSTDFLKYPDEEWTRTAITEAASNNLLPYRLTNRYGENITREEFCVLVGNLIAKVNNYKDIDAYAKDDETIYNKMSFIDCNDVDSSIEILQRMGIINGKSESTFEPYSPVTREEAAKILCGVALKLAGENSSLACIDPGVTLSFNDANEISDWAKYYVNWAYQKWIMNGDEGNNFHPRSYYTIDQAVITVNRIFKTLKGL